MNASAHGSFERVAGRIPVLECLRAKKRTARRLYIAAGARDVDALRDAARGVPTETVERRELDRLTQGTEHQGVVLEANPLPVVELTRWLERPLREEMLVVILDGVEDPHNFGAIVRSAAACGADAVLFAKDRAAPLTPAVYKAAAGAIEYIDLIRATNLARSLGQLRDAGFWSAALDAQGDRSLWDAPLTGRMVLVIGSEGAGIRRLVLENCDFKVRIPIAGPITSLNASVSAGIVLSECMRQRTVKNTATP